MNTIKAVFWIVNVKNCPLCNQDEYFLLTVGAIKRAAIRSSILPHSGTWTEGVYSFPFCRMPPPILMNNGIHISPAAVAGRGWNGRSFFWKHRINHWLSKSSNRAASMPPSLNVIRAEPFSNSIMSLPVSCEKSVTIRRNNRLDFNPDHGFVCFPKISRHWYFVLMKTR